MTATFATDLTDISREAESLSPWMCEHRRHLHRHPELSFQEKETSAYLRRQVEALGLTPSAPVAEGKYGFYVDLISLQNPKSFVLLRADFDALPIAELNDVDFRSTRDGVGHLCGHDAHSSMLLTALRILKDRTADLPVSVRFVFQHAEETSPGGAVDFVRAGLVEDCVGCFGLHVSPQIESGDFGLCIGETMAMVGSVEATIRGRGGHAAMPHECNDPMPAAVACVTALQTISSRRVPPTEPVVISITTINAGTAYNVIPNEVKFGGTIRTFNEERAPQLAEWIHEIIENTAIAHGCTADVRTAYSYPPVVNDEAAIAAARESISTMFGEDAAQTFGKKMGAEDFAYYAREKPSAFVFIGVRPPGGEFYPLHHPQFLPDESVLWRGAALLASLPFVAPNYLKG